MINSIALLMFLSSKTFLHHHHPSGFSHNEPSSVNVTEYFACLFVFNIFQMNLRESLLLGRKVLTNLDSLLKSRDITLPTKVRLVKAMVFPVVMYGCESWSIKKAER